MLRASYDESPYPLNSYPESAPGQLAVVAHLFGLDVPPVADARVLEIGSALGGNLIPFAAQYPRAHAVGVDLSPGQTEQARRYVQAAGLDNVTLVAGDISDLDVDALGSFDYVVCHGVYSWVPEKVRESILSVMQQVLSPDGVGYVSYNVYPGWKSKEIVREAMLFASADSDTQAARVQAAREVVEFLGEMALPGSATARAVTDHHAAGTRADYYLLHEELELFNTPCYFTEFASRARSYGLAYLSESQPEYMFARNFGADLAGRLTARCGDDHVLLQQYLDLAINRSFRQSLLVHQERAVDVRHSLDRKRFDTLHFAAWLPPVDGETRLDGSVQEFRGSDTATLVTSDSVQKVALDVLNASWPWTLSWAELIDSVGESLPFPRGAERLEDRIEALLELLITQGQVRYRLDPVRPQQDSTLRLDEPARRLAVGTREDSDAYSFTAWHEMVVLAPFDRYLLPLLDGTRDRADLVDAMLGYVRRRAIEFRRAARQLTDDGELREVIATRIDRLPYRLAGMNLTQAADVPPDEWQSTSA